MPDNPAEASKPALPEPVMPQSEQLKGLKPETTTQLVQSLAGRLQGADTLKTPEMDKKEYDVLIQKLSEKKSFLGRPKTMPNDPDKLWVALHILYPEDAVAETAYAIIRQAQIVAGNKPLPEEWKNKNLREISTKARGILQKNPGSLGRLNKGQIMIGEMAVLPLLQASMDEVTTKKEEKAAVDPELEKDKRRMIAKFAAGYPELPMVQGRAKAEDLINRWIEFHHRDTEWALHNVADLTGWLDQQDPNTAQQLASLIPKNLALQYGAIPWDINSKEFIVVFNAIPNQEVLDKLAAETGRHIHSVLAYPGQVQATIDKFYPAATEPPAPAEGKKEASIDKREIENKTSVQEILGQFYRDQSSGAVADMIKESIAISNTNLDPRNQARSPEQTTLYTQLLAKHSPELAEAFSKYARAEAEKDPRSEEFVRRFDTLLRQAFDSQFTYSELQKADVQTEELGKSFLAAVDTGRIPGSAPDISGIREALASYNTQRANAVRMRLNENRQLMTFYKNLAEQAGLEIITPDPNYYSSLALKPVQSNIPPATDTGQELSATAEESVESGWRELRNALWQSKLASEQAGQSLPPSEQEIAAARKIVNKLNQMEASEAAAVFRQYPPRFIDAVMPEFERMHADRYRDVARSMSEIAQKKFDESLGGYTSFETVVSDLEDYRNKNYEKIFRTSYANEEGQMERDEHSRLMGIVINLASRIDLDSTDPVYLDLNRVGDDARGIIFAKVKDMGNNAPVRWQEAMSAYIQRYYADNPNRYTDRLDNKICADRLQQMYNQLYGIPPGTLSLYSGYTGTPKSYDELRSDIARYLEAFNTPDNFDEEFKILFRRFPPNIQSRLVDSIRGSLEAETVMAVESAQKKLMDEERKVDLFREEQDRYDHANTPEIIIAFMKRVYAFSQDKNLDKDNGSVWYRYDRSSYESVLGRLEEQLDRALNLPEDERAGTARKELDRLQGIRTMYFSAHSFQVTDDQQAKLFERLFSSAPELKTSLSELLKQQTKDLSQRDDRKYEVYREFNRLHRELAYTSAGIVEDRNQISSWRKMQEKFYALLSDPQASEAEIQTTLIECNRAHIQELRQDIKQNQALHDYDEKLAESADLTIKYQFGDLPILKLK